MSETETSGERLARLKDRLAETEIQAQCGAAFVNESCLGYSHVRKGRTRFDRKGNGIS